MFRIPKPKLVDLARHALFLTGGAAESASAHSAEPKERVVVLPMDGAVQPKVLNRCVGVAIGPTSVENQSQNYENPFVEHLGTL